MQTPDRQERFYAALHRADQRIARQRPLIEQAVASLAREGHTVLASGVGPGRPYVYLANSAALGEFALAGRAAYVARGVDDDGHWRRGELLDYRNVLVTWIERGH